MLYIGKELQISCYMEGIADKIQSKFYGSHLSSKTRHTEESMREFREDLSTPRKCGVTKHEFPGANYTVRDSHDKDGAFPFVSGLILVVSTNSGKAFAKAGPSDQLFKFLR